MNFATMSQGATFVGVLHLGIPVGKRVGAQIGDSGVYLEPIEEEWQHVLYTSMAEQLQALRISAVTGVFVASPSPLELALEAEMLRYAAQCIGDPAPQA